MTADIAELTIDQLARRTGMSARNIRAHQSRGLLARPTLRGRTGYYNDEHVARVELIQQLQSAGFSLDLISRLVEMTNGSTEEAMRFARALRHPSANDQPLWPRGDLTALCAAAWSELGVPNDEILEVVAQAQAHVDEISAAFVGLFAEYVWEPFDAAGQPEEGLERVREMIERMKPLASAALLSLFGPSVRKAAVERVGPALDPH
jgi:DNA-binding transcriptional MerR regulator